VGPSRPSLPLFVAALLTLVGCSFYAYEQRDDGWTTYASRAGFTVDVPGPPFRETVEQLDNARLGQLETHFLTTRGSDGTRYAVVYADFPESYVKSGADVLGEALKRDEENLQVQAVDPHAVTVAGYPALEYGIERPKDAWAVRLVLAGRRLYALSVTGTRESVKSDEARRFLESFSVSSS
jgi:hypothetical protein